MKRFIFATLVTIVLVIMFGFLITFPLIFLNCCTILGVYGLGYIMFYEIDKSKHKKRFNYNNEIFQEIDEL